MLRPGDIEVKNTCVLIGLMERNFHPLLIHIITGVTRKRGIMITESYREPRQRGDVHSTNPVRALDLREWDYPDSVAKQIEYEINARWEYDPNRPELKVARIHKVKGGTIHFHIQVHHRTRLREF